MVTKQDEGLFDSFKRLRIATDYLKIKKMPFADSAKTTPRSRSPISHKTATTRHQPQPPQNVSITNVQSFGESDSSQITKNDLLSAIAFDPTGKFLAVGDRGGRVIMFSAERSPADEPLSDCPSYEYLAEC